MYPTRSTCTECIASWSIITILAQCVQLLPRYGEEVSKCRRDNGGIPSMNCETRIRSGHFFPHTEFQHNAFSHSRDAGKVYTRGTGHVQLYPTPDLCRAPSYLVSNFAPDFSTISPAVPELWKRDSTCALADLSHPLLVLNT